MELCFCKFIAVLDIPILRVTSDKRSGVAEFRGEKSRYYDLQRTRNG
jgi:hypothetical protein